MKSHVFFISHDMVFPPMRWVTNKVVGIKSQWWISINMLIKRGILQIQFCLRISIFLCKKKKNHFKGKGNSGGKVMLIAHYYNGQSLFPLCSQFHQLFASYKHYCWEEEHCLEFTRRQMESNPHFFTFVQVTQSAQKLATARPVFIVNIWYVAREEQWVLGSVYLKMVEQRWFASLSPTSWARP